MTDKIDLRLIEGGGDKRPDPDPPETITREDWIALGCEFAQATSQASWAFADWLAAGHAAWGADAMREAAEATGASPGKIRNYRRTSVAYPIVRRRIELAFSHHLEVARLPEAEAERILDTALDESWSRDRTRAAAREASAEGQAARLRRENAQLKRALRHARADARDVADHARDRLDGERRVIRNSLRRIVKIASELASADALEGLHGNARRAVGRDLRKLGDMLADNLEGALDELGAAAAIIDGHQE